MALSAEHAQASAMSCSAMAGMAAREFEADQVYQSYLLLDPSCARFHGLADRGLEHALFKTWESKKQCVDSINRDGPWTAQFGPLLDRPCFEVSTRAKTIGAASSRACGLSATGAMGATGAERRPTPDPRLQDAAARAAAAKCPPRT